RKARERPWQLGRREAPRRGSSRRIPALCAVGATAMIQAERGTGLVLAGGPLQGRRVVLFFRDFVQFFGGHLKILHYFEHVRDSSRHMPVIAFSPRTRWDEGNPWSRLRAQAAEVVPPARPDVLFVAGLDWLSLAPAD